MKIKSVEAIAICIDADPDSPSLMARGGSAQLSPVDALRMRNFARHQTCLVRIETDTGAVGWGEGQEATAPRVIRTIIEDICAPMVIGRNPFDIEAIWADQYQFLREAGHLTGFYIDALAGIDLALYDLIGNLTDQPVHRLLGGRMRDRLKAYAGIGGGDPDATAEMAADHVTDGFRALKLHISRQSNDRCVEIVRAVRARVGEDVELMVDVHIGKDVSEAIKLGRRLEDLNVQWLESPTAPEDPYGSADIARALDLQIASGEWLRTAWQWREFLEAHALDVAMPDISRSGLTESKRIAQLCDTYNIPVTPHVGRGGTMALAASIQFGATVPNFQIIEHMHRVHEQRSKICTVYPSPVDGEFLVTDTPGMGVTIDEDAVRGYAI
ncbi:MAG: mandelate racemase/muconate lactonizing enzyme family protein [Dehalococcoidia bacterium]|jgi:L-alanine-DL-glutamate epimerase-like enolase superfamily enzyme|nr:mandelate racemase/muconate lactonizing enzyme family protein [Dehalococcoidia bacterium]